MQLKCNVLNELWKFGREAFRYAELWTYSVPLIKRGADWPVWGSLNGEQFKMDCSIYDFTGRCEVTHRPRLVSIGVRVQKADDPCVFFFFFSINLSYVPHNNSSFKEISSRKVSNLPSFSCLPIVQLFSTFVFSSSNSKVILLCPSTN